MCFDEKRSVSYLPVIAHTVVDIFSVLLLLLLLLMLLLLVMPVLVLVLLGVLVSLKLLLLFTIFNDRKKFTWVVQINCY